MLHSKKLIRIFSDLIAINSSLFLTYYWCYKDLSFITKQDLRVALILVNLIWFSTLFNENRLYGRFEYVTFKEEIKNAIRNYISHFLFFSSIQYFIGTLETSNYFLWWLCFYSLFLMTLFIGRYSLKIVFANSSRIETLNYVVIGHSEALTAIEKTLSDTHFGKVQYLGFFSKDGFSGENYLGAVDCIYDFLKSTKANLILYASNEMPFLEMRQLMNYAKLNFIDFKIIPIEIEMLSSGIKMEIHNGFPLLSVKNENIARIRNRFLKRFFDIIFSVLVIVLLFSWLFPILMILIKLDSRGPIFFIQRRVGFENKPFWCYKFRSMQVNKDADILQAKVGDSRITKFGSFLRKSNMDELPQFLNVLQGNMSIVGPRPHPFNVDEDIKNEMHNYLLRYYTKPGVTGWAQVNGWRGPTQTIEQKKGRTEHDIWYLRNWSFWLDIKIIWMTVFSSKSRENAF